MTFKTAIVTGGGRGIGAAISKLLAACLLFRVFTISGTCKEYMLHNGMMRDNDY